MHTDTRKNRAVSINTRLSFLAVNKSGAEGSMETSIFVPDLAQQFFLSGVGPSHPVAAPLRVARAGTHGFF